MADGQPSKRLGIDPAVWHGQPCIRGTRVLVVNVLDGLTTPEIVEQYPTPIAEDVRAAAAYGARWPSRGSTR